jgi:hypothetical protein
VERGLRGRGLQRRRSGHTAAGRKVPIRWMCYNVIQWVHRGTRGWSCGMSVRDPRTQEILKGHVTLGSLRVRQDYLLAEGLLFPLPPPGSPI